MSEVNETIARAAFAEIRAARPSLVWEVELDNPGCEIDIVIPAQLGLKHAIKLSLQADELHFLVGHFWLEWFPCSDATKTRDYIDAVSGFIAGTHRVIEHYQGENCIKAILQRPEGQGWETIGTWSKLRLPSFRRPTMRVVANV